MASDAPVFIEDVPEITLSGGHFHIRYRLGRDWAEFVLPPDVFLKALLLAEEVRAKWQLGIAPANNVHRIRKK